MKNFSLNEQIRFYEELSFNSHPSLQTQYYDGWILRFSNGYTNRANSVNMIYPSMIDLQTKVEYCEKCYSQRQLPCVFKVTDGSDEWLDAMLEGRGYWVVTPTDLMVMDLADMGLAAEQMASEDMAGKQLADKHCVTGMQLSDMQHMTEKQLLDKRLVAEKPDIGVCIITEEPTDEWLEAYFALEHCTNSATRETAVQMMHMIQPRTFYCRIEVDGKSVACASAILERGYVTLVHVIVDEEYRRQGYGRQLCEALLAEAVKHGAHTAYLQVLQNNAPAIHLYETLGYQKIYSYWYRVRKL